MDLGPAEPLNLHEAVQLALSHNLEIQIRSIVPGIFDDRATSARGDFDPELEIRVRAEDLATAQSTQEFVSTGGSPFELDEENPENRIFEEDNIRSEAQVAGKFTTGTEYEIGFRANQLENDLTRDNATSLFETEVKTFAGLTLTQPLLRDFGPGVNKSKIQVAAHDQQISRLKFRETVEQILLEVALDYYEQLLAYQAFESARLEVAIADATMEALKDQLERGALSEAEYRVARTEQVEAVERMLLARQTLFLKNADLQSGIRQDADFSDLPLLIPDAEFLLEAPEEDFTQLAEVAREQNAAYQAALEKVEKLNVELRYHRNQRLPRLDLEATFGLNGIDEDIGASFSETMGSEGHEYAVGLVLKVPLGNRRTRGRIQETRKMLRQAVLEVKKAEQDTYHALRQKLTSVEVSALRMQATRVSRENAESNLEAARSALEKGLGSELLVQELGFELAQVRLRELSSAVDRQRSLLELYRHTGTLLTRVGVELTEDTRPL